MVLFVGRPYTKEIRRSTIKGMVDKMATIGGKRKLHANEFKKLVENSPELAHNANYRRIAHNMYKSMKGSGPRDIAVRTHHAKGFIKALGKALKKGEHGVENLKATRFGKRAAANPNTSFQTYVVETQIDKDKPKGPSSEELERNQQMIDARKKLRQTEQMQEIYGRFANPLAAARREQPLEEKTTSLSKASEPQTSATPTPGVDSQDDSPGTISQMQEHTASVTDKDTGLTEEKTDHAKKDGQKSSEAEAGTTPLAYGSSSLERTSKQKTKETGSGFTGTTPVIPIKSESKIGKDATKKDAEDEEEETKKKKINEEDLPTGGLFED